MLSNRLSKFTDQFAQFRIGKPIDLTAVNQTKLTVLHNMQPVNQLVDFLMNSTHEHDNSAVQDKHTAYLHTNSALMLLIAVILTAFV